MSTVVDILEIIVMAMDMMAQSRTKLLTKASGARLMMAIDMVVAIDTMMERGGDAGLCTLLAVKGRGLVTLIGCPLLLLEN